MRLANRGRNYRRGRQQAQTTSGMTSMLNPPRMEGLFASSTEPQQGNFGILNFEAPTRNTAQRTTIEGTAGRSSRDRMPSDHTSAAPPPPLRRPKRAAATQAMTSNDIPTTEGVITIDEDHQRHCRLDNSVIVQECPLCSGQNDG
ncbi:hypothetical protein K2173_021734 [Erythroxylum novogranatense]|uniref:Uncharacterized protein n=1 Tax=Erythroxylum novogranatense TaxID=1862640 RepID=A0AAV8S5L8_9ROSI|nr:hypothetical protein K2173_021734 [Erythroxylum novogranatense]